MGSRRLPCTTSEMLARLGVTPRETAASASSPHGGRRKRRGKAAWLALVVWLAPGCSEPRDSAATTTLAPRRVAVLAPAAAEMLEALGLLDRVVGVGDFGPWPEAIADLPSLGGYDAPNVERVLELGVEAVLTAASDAAGAAHRRLEALGVRVVALDTSTYDGVFAALHEIGVLFDRVERAAAVEREMRQALGGIAERAAGLPRPRVLFVVGRDPLFVAGPGSHIDEMIAMAGGRNVAHDALTPYQQVSLESILERMPEVIIDTSDNSPGALRGRHLGAWGRWEFLPAVRQDRVYWIDPGRLVIPGLRLPEMTRLMARLIHPEVFGEDESAEPSR